MSIIVLTVITALLHPYMGVAGTREQELLSAAEIGDIHTLDTLIANGATHSDLEMKWKEVVPLHVAASNGRHEFVSRLLSKGVNPDVKDYYGYRAITLAVVNGQTDAVKVLVEHGSDIFAEDDVDDVKYYLLETAASNGHVDLVEYFLDNGADINHQSDEKNTPLIMAALYGHDKVVEVLLARGADMKIRNMQGNTALIAAAFKGHARAVRVLIQNGDDPNTVNDDGTCAMLLAARGNFPKVIRELIKGGAKVDVTDKFNNTPLSISAKSNHMDSVSQLLAAGADMEVVDASGLTALHHTFVNNHREAAKALALAGASHGSSEKHTGIAAANIPKAHVCFWFKGLLKRFRMSQKQTRGQFTGRRACDHLAEVLNLKGSVVKLLDMVSFYGYKATVERLGFDAFAPDGMDERVLEELKKTARADLKSMHTKDYREHFRQTDEEEMEKNLPGLLRKFGADIPEPPKEDDLSLADIANEKVTKHRKQFHRAAPEDRPDHFRDAESVPEAEKNHQHPSHEREL